MGIILEWSVMDKLANLLQVFCLLFFNWFSPLHLDYPKCIRNTFYFIQQVMLNLAKSELAPKIQTLEKKKLCKTRNNSILRYRL